MGIHPTGELNDFDEMDHGIADGMLVTLSTFHLLLLTSRFRDLSGGALVRTVAVVDLVDRTSKASA